MVRPNNCIFFNDLCVIHAVKFPFGRGGFARKVDVNQGEGDCEKLRKVGKGGGDQFRPETG